MSRTDCYLSLPLRLTISGWEGRQVEAVLHVVGSTAKAHGVGHRVVSREQLNSEHCVRAKLLEIAVDTSLDIGMSLTGESSSSVGSYRNSPIGRRGSAMRPVPVRSTHESVGCSRSDRPRIS